MSTFVLSIGNTSLFGGVRRGRGLRAFRIANDDFAALREELKNAGPIEAAVVCSVVPALTAKVARLIERESGIAPQVLTSASPHGLKIAYADPSRLGTDRLAAALGARALFHRQHAIVVDCGTATTVTAVSKTGVVAGGAILPGPGLWATALAGRTAQLPAVKVVRPRRATGRSPEEAIASGIYFGHLGAVQELVKRVRAETFGRAQVVVVGTGGNVALHRREKLFTVEKPDLILYGLLSQTALFSHHA